MEIISKYLEDKRFIQWAFNPNEELEEWWSNFQSGHPDEKRNIQTARNILLNLKTDNKRLSEEEKIILFTKILKQIEEKQQSKKKVIVITSLLKYAAVAVIFFGIGALLFYKENKFNPQFSTENITVPLDDDDAKLIRSNGESIVLEDDKSVIKYDEEGNILINNQEIESTEPQQKKRKPQLNQLVIPYGKTSEILLADGTKVYLNAGSKLVYPEFFNGKNREVLLIGEAYFEVKEDKSHPFIVQTTDLRVKVLGTQFNISSYPNDNVIETVLTEGSVVLEENNSGILSGAMELVPGQMASFSKKTQETKLQKVDVENYTLWKEGLYKFESTDLSRVIKKLERYYNLRFHYTDPLLGMVKISGKLDLKESREEILSRVSTAASVQIIKKGEVFYEIK